MILYINAFVFHTLHLKHSTIKIAMFKIDIMETIKQFQHFLTWALFRYTNR